jgi:hypothetical protein
MTQMGCTTDPCAKISCQNGGNCESGTCKCPSGYYGANCEKGEVCRINSYSTTIPSLTHTLTYDGFGRIVVDMATGITTAYTYSQGLIDMQTTYSSSADYTKAKYIVNSKGYPMTQYAEYSSQGILAKDTVHYNYDANDYFVGFSGTGYSLTYTYANGNRVSGIYTLHGQTYYTISYEYYTDKPRSNVYDSQYVDKLGANEKNMRKKNTRNYADGTKQVYEYSYEYNSKGAVTKEIEVYTAYDASNVVTSTSTTTSTFDIACLQP